MSDRKIRYEILIEAVLIVVAIASIAWAQTKFFGDIALLDLSRLDVKASMQNLATLLSLLSLAMLFSGAIAGYLIGKYSHIK